MPKDDSMKNMNEFYDSGEYYSGLKFFLMRDRFVRYKNKKVDEICHISKDERVLDLGCAGGIFCFALANNCREIVGVDFSSKVIEEANKLLKGKPCKNVSFVCADARNTGLKEGYFDVILCVDLLEHLYRDDSEKVFDECKRLLKNGGKLIIWTPYKGHFLEILKTNNIILKKDVSHVDYKPMGYILKTLEKRNFKILKHYYCESHIPIINLAERLLMPALPIMRRRIAVLAEKWQ